MRGPRTLHTATLLRDGRVLLAGGVRLADAGAPVVELFDPADDSIGDGPAELTPRGGHVALELLDGRVLLAAGAANAELFDPATNALLPAGALASAPSFICAARTSEGDAVLIGNDQRAYRYQPASNGWLAEAALSRPRQSCAAWALPGGEVLVSGGVGTGDAGISATSEVLSP
jgi:hypothetical protein